MAAELTRGEAQLVDVRERHEAAAGRLAASEVVPLSVLRDRRGLPPGSKLSPTLTTYLHCAAGARVHPAAALMRSMGYARVVPLREGFAALVSMGFEVESQVSTATADAPQAGGAMPMPRQDSGAAPTAGTAAPAAGGAFGLLAWAVGGASAAAAGGGAPGTASRVAAARASLRAELSPDHVDIRAEAGGSDAFEAVVVAERFADLPLLERHRLVLRIVAPHLGDAVSVKAKTPKQWARVASNPDRVSHDTTAMWIT
jgi:rhodanese-related sulfurtransferase/stress-induced morphogen